MDIEFRNLLRTYSAEPSDELAHRLARMMLRSTGPDSLDLMERFYQAYWWLFEHPLFKYKGASTSDQSCFPDCLNITTQKVDPKTQCIEDDKSRNTRVAVWIEVRTYSTQEEAGIPDDQMLEGWDWTGVPCHDYELDCGGDTFEEAIIELAKLVKANRTGQSNTPADTVTEDEKWKSP
jgi:hypothetical protein